MFFLLLRYHVGQVGGDSKNAPGRSARIVTGCVALDEFTAAFRSLCNESSIFLPTETPLAVQANLRFAIALKNRADGSPGNTVLRGTGSISESFEDAANTYGRSGMVLDLGRLDSMGRILLRELNAAEATPKPDFSANADSDESFDVSTLVENPSLEELMAEKQARSALGPDAAERARMVSCTVIWLDTNVEGDTEAEGETTQVADIASVDGSPTAPPSDAPGPVVSAAKLDASEGVDFSEHDDIADEKTMVSEGPGLAEAPSLAEALDAITDIEELEEEDRGAPTRVVTMQPPVEPVVAPAAPKAVIGRTAPVPRPVGAGETYAPSAAKKSGAQVSAPQAPAPQAPAPQAPAPQAPAPQAPAPQVSSRQASSTHGPHPSPQTVPLASAEGPISEETAVAPVPTPLPRPAPKPQPCPPSEVAPQGSEAIAAAIAETVVEPTVASHPLPSVSSTSQPAAARSIASLPMVSPTFGGGTSQPPTPAMVRRSQAALFGIVCLATGFGVGGLVAGAIMSSGESTPPESEAKGTQMDSEELGARPALVPPGADAAPAVSTDAAATALPDAAILDASTTAKLEEDATPARMALDCELVLDVTPVDANVLIGGVAVENGASPLAVACGATTVRIEHEKYANHQLDIEVVQGSPFVLLHHMKRDMVTLRVVSTPRKAWVKINGEGVGRTPMRRAVPAHEPVEIRVSRAGFKPLIRTMTPTEDVGLDLQLRRFGKKRKRGSR